jgi:hypothetical protein
MVQTHLNPILASDILCKRGHYPIRIIMYENEDSGEYIVHEELLTTMTPTEGKVCEFKHHSLNGGSYFNYRISNHNQRLEAEREAEKEFEYRVALLFGRY